MQHFTIATRESRLALWQANHVKALLEQQGHQVTLLGMTTNIITMDLVQLEDSRTWLTVITQTALPLIYLANRQTHQAMAWLIHSIVSHLNTTLIHC